MFLQSIAIIVSFAIATVFVRWMWRAWKRKQQSSESQDDGEAQFELICVSGPLNGHRFPLYAAKPQTIGREANNDIQIANQSVSRTHALIELVESGFLLRDFNSTNGTWLWNLQQERWERILLITLGLDQVFQIGPYRFKTASLGAEAGDIKQWPEASNQNQTIIRTDIPEVYADDFQLMHEIGRGGAASVYLARRLRDQRQVAIKYLLNSVDNYFQQKFEHEIEINRKLRAHPHIVPVIGISNQEPLFIVMEYMEGGSLRDLIRSQGPIPLQKAIQIVGSICLALDYAHEQNVFHRDLKPENILFDAQENAYLADFGIARLTQLKHVTQDGMSVGTPEYMSSEQAKGEVVDGRSDQYALAIVLYETLTGRCPFQGTVDEIVRQHIESPAPPPSTYNPTIPSYIEGAILRALAKNRQERFSNAQAFSNALGYQSVSEASHLGQPVNVNHQIQLVEQHSGQTIAILDPNQSPLYIGRSQLPYEGVSRKHAIIWFENGNLLIQDAGSRNGTYVDSKRVLAAKRLSTGLIIQLGAACLTVQ